MQQESSRTLDVNGWTEIKNNPLSKSGVFPYSGRQLPGADPDRMYMVYRPAEELAAPECIDSFRLLPWIDNHVMLGPEDAGMTPAEDKGVQGVIGEDIYFDGETLFGNLKVFSESMAGLIEAGKKELSCGYRCKYEHSPGEHKGVRYDFIQREIRGNHLALVNSGRMGPAVAVLDHFTFTVDSKDIQMAEETKESTPGMSLEDAIKAIEQVMPAIKMLQDAAGGNTTTPADEPVVTPAAVDVLPEEKEDEGEKKDDDEKKEGEGMDAAAVFRSVTAQIAKRDRLYAQLSAHVGAFDHAEMTAEQVAEYGVKKLGIKADKGTEVSALSGYLQAKGAPAKPSAKAMDSGESATGNFVTRHLNKKEGK